MSEGITESTVEEWTEAIIPDQSENVTEQAHTLIDMFTGFVERLMQPWSLYQVSIIIAIFIIAYGLRMVLRPYIRTRLGQSHGIPKWALRLCIICTNRLSLMLFAIFSWSTYLAMQAATWPSRSYFIGIVASIAAAWFIISVLAKLIRNKVMSGLVKWAGWIYATLQITGLWESISELFDTIAIDTGGIRISLLMVLTAIITLAVLFALAGFLSKGTASRIAKIDDMSPSIKVLITKATQMVFYGFAFMFSLSAVGFDLSNLALLSGAIGLGIGFGLQKIVSNLVSGIIILLDKSIKPGDVISLDGTFGWITQLGARYASVTTRDGREHLIPNEDFITNQVINWSHSSDFVRLDIHFGVDYKSNPHDVKRLAALAPLTVDRVVKVPSPVCHVVNFGDSSIDFILRFWIRDPNKGLTNIRGNVYLALWDTLEENNINIPYPRREITMLNSPQDDEVKATRKK